MIRIEQIKLRARLLSNVSIGVIIVAVALLPSHPLRAVLLAAAGVVMFIVAHASLDAKQTRRIP